MSAKGCYGCTWSCLLLSKVGSGLGGGPCQGGGTLGAGSANACLWCTANQGLPSCV